MVKILTFLVLFSTFSAGGIKIPRHAHRMQNLDEAKLEAQEKNKPLAFVRTDPGSTWGPCNAAAYEAFKKLRSVAIIVFVHTKRDFRSLPTAVRKGLLHNSSGRFIPKTVITDSACKEWILSVRYEAWKDSSKTIRRIKKRLKEHEAEQAEDTMVTMPKKSKKTEYRSWTNERGKTIEASFIALSGQNVVMKTRAGKEVSYPLSKLSAECQELVKSLNDGKQEAVR